MKSSDDETTSWLMNQLEPSSAACSSPRRATSCACSAGRSCRNHASAACSCARSRRFLQSGCFSTPPAPSEIIIPSMRQPSVADDDMTSRNCMYRILVTPLSRSSAVTDAGSTLTILSTRSSRSFWLDTSFSRKVRVPILMSITHGRE